MTFKKIAAKLSLYSLYISKFDAVSSFKFPSLLRELWDSRKASQMWRGFDAGYYLMDQVVLPDQVLDISASP
jgi:hypothetical protein